jgi:cardiolipin synthase
MAFTGGMNIHRRYVRKAGYSEPRMHDIHFKIQGASLRSLSSIFAKDWFFATGESLKPRLESAVYEAPGRASIRVIPSGPNQSQETLALLFRGIFTTAKESIRIMTPYFILDPTLMTLMQLAVLRGVNVEIILPEKNNLFFMKAACESLLSSLLRSGVKVYYRSGSFAHSKLVIVDHAVALVGSANWDARSFYLNFELTIQVLDISFLAGLNQHFEMIRSQSRSLAIADLQSQPIVIKLRNAFFRLFSPYL